MHDTKCKRDEIINPKTARCVKKTGKVGLEILRKNSPCKRDEIINPKTARCVKKTGVIGRKLLLRTPSKRSKRKTPSPAKNKKLAVQLPNKPSVAVAKVVNECKWERVWKKGRKIGAGAVGSIFTACDSDGCNYILKIQKDDDEFRNEVKILAKIRGWKHAPKVFGIWTCKGKGYIVEEKLLDLKFPKVMTFFKVQRILTQLHKNYRIAFPDCHEGNIMMRADETVVLIDFGWAEYFSSNTAKSSTDTWLSDKLKRPVMLKEMALWEANNLADAFGNAVHKKEANEAMRQLIKNK
jgi:tRNA A-37 threonylcarbamoyl transferase component Bud32